MNELSEIAKGLRDINNSLKELIAIMKEQRDVTKQYAHEHLGFCPWCGEQLIDAPICSKHGDICGTEFDTSVRVSAGIYEARRLTYGIDKPAKVSIGHADKITAGTIDWFKIADSGKHGWTKINADTIDTTLLKPAKIWKDEYFCPLCGEELLPERPCICSSHGNMATLYGKYGFELQSYDTYMKRMRTDEHGVLVVAPRNFKNML